MLSYVGTGDYGLAGMAAANFGANNTAAGRLTFSWDDPNATGVTVVDGAVIFSVEFDAVGAAGSSSTVAFGNTPTAQEATVNFEAATFTAQPGTVTVGTVANVPPTVSLSATPTSANAGQAITLTATAADSDGAVTKVEFFDGATKLGEDTMSPYSLVVSTLPAGTHSLTARATDNGGAAATSAAVGVTINVAGNLPPTVSLSATPTTATAGQTVNLTATAADSDGTVAKVEFFNGAIKLGEDTSAPFTLAVATLSAGTHSLTARATDNGGAATTSAAVSVTVQGASGDGVTFRANPATAAPGSRFKVNLSVAGFAAVTTAQFTLEWNPAVLSYVGTGDYGLTGMAGTNFGANNTAAGRLTFSWDDPNATGVTVADGTVVFSVEFDAAGAAGTSSAVSFGDTPTAREVTVNFEGKSFVGEAATVTVENVVQNVPPTVSLSASPTSANVGQSVTLTATATDSDGTVAKVEFFDGATKLGEDTTSPYSLVVSTLPAGTHSLTARATDNGGAAATSAAVGVTVNPASGGIAIRRLNGYIPGQLLTVTVSVTPPAGTIAYGIEETPPTGWQVSQISDGGEFDPANGKVKWTFLDATTRSLTYRLTVPANASGSYFFNGIANVDGTSTATIGGDTELKRADQHPADVNPADWSPGLAEVLRYATAYKKGEMWTVPPLPVELGYVIRGFTLYKRGERYQLDPSIATPPAWWVNVGAGAGGSAASMARQASPVESATRELPETYEPAQPLTVSITVAPADGTVAYGVEEVPPAGWLVDQISDTGELDSINGKVKWTFLDGTARTLTYRLTPTAEAQGSATVSGKVNFDGLRELAIGGDTSMSAGSEPPPTAQIGLYAGVLVTGQIGATYVVEGTEDVTGQDGWTELVRLTLTQPSQLFVDENSPLKPQQFYRVRRP